MEGKEGQVSPQLSNQIQQWDKTEKAALIGVP